MTLEELGTAQSGEQSSQTAEKPNTQTGYTGSYDGRIKSLYEKIAGRKGFEYVPSADPVYAAYKQNYQQQGKAAMRDTMAEAAHLTGGYGSSYSQRVGQQQYGQYLEKLGNVLPELYSQAYSRYMDEGDSLNDEFNAAMALGSMEYQRYADALERSGKQAEFDYKKQADAFGNLYDAALEAGYTPSAEELEAAGMSAEFAAALAAEFKRRTQKSGVGYIAPSWTNYSPSTSGSSDNKSSTGSKSASTGSGSSGSKTVNKIIITPHA